MLKETWKKLLQSLSQWLSLHQNLNAYAEQSLFAARKNPRNNVSWSDMTCAKRNKLLIIVLAMPMSWCQ